MEGPHEGPASTHPAGGSAKVALDLAHPQNILPKSTGSQAPQTRSLQIGRSKTSPPNNKFFKEAASQAPDGEIVFFGRLTGAGWRDRFFQPPHRRRMARLFFFGRLTGVVSCMRVVVTSRFRAPCFSHRRSNESIFRALESVRSEESEPWQSQEKSPHGTHSMT